MNKPRIEHIQNTALLVAVGLTTITISLEGNVNLMHVSHVLSPEHLVEGSCAVKVDIGWLEGFTGALFLHHGTIFNLILYERKIRIVVLVLVVSL